MQAADIGFEVDLKALEQFYQGAVSSWRVQRRLVQGQQHYVQAAVADDVRPPFLVGAVFSAEAAAATPVGSTRGKVTGVGWPV